MRLSTFLLTACLSSVLADMNTFDPAARLHSRDIKVSPDAAILDSRALEHTKSGAKKGSKYCAIGGGAVGLAVGQVTAWFVGKSIGGLVALAVGAPLGGAGAIVGGIGGAAIGGIKGTVTKLKSKLNHEEEVQLPKQTLEEIWGKQKPSNEQLVVCGIKDKPHTATDHKWDPCYENFSCGPLFMGLPEFGGLYKYTGETSKAKKLCINENCQCISGFKLAPTSEAGPPSDLCETSSQAEYSSESSATS